MDQQHVHRAKGGTVQRLAPVGVWTLVAILVVWWARSTPDGCPQLRWRAYTAGHSTDFDAAVASCGAALGSGARTELIVAGVVFVVLMVSLIPVLRPLWASSWHAPPFLHWTWVPVVPAVAAVLGSVATLALAVGLESEPLRLTTGAAAIVSATAWPAAIFGAGAALATAVSVLATIGSRSLSDTIADGRCWTPPDVGGSGVCVSGGGIRAGAFALGALAYLERHDDTGRPVRFADSVLEQATYLASVSGGGYTAGAWRIARGTRSAPTAWPNGVFGDLDVDEFDTVPAPGRAFDEQTDAPAGLFHHMWARREFLRTGRGGLASTAAMFGATVVLQIILLGAGLMLAAWPLGALAASWPILGEASFGQDPYRFAVDTRSVVPLLLTIGVAALLVVVRSTMMRTQRRLAIDALVGVCLLVSVILAATLLALPLAIDGADGVSYVGGVATFSAAGGIAVTGWKVVSSVLRPAWSRFGGVLLAFAALGFSVVVATAAAVPGGALADVSWWWYIALLVGFLLVWSYADPRWWSLAPVYRNRLRSAFAVQMHKSSPQPGIRRPLRSRDEATLDEYADAPGPALLTCCAVARSNRNGTGIPALSLVFSADDVRFYEGHEADGVRVHQAPAGSYVRALASAADWPLTGGRTRALGTVTAAMAMSGAAVSSAMGRMDFGSTNSLIAGLNVRVGAWVPNPRRVAVDDQPAKRARVNYLVKELFGWYDLRDPHVYVTDGGHWDNLGLVELLRRRCATIVCVDASGDQPGSFQTLRQALDLARIECGARVDIEAGLATMRARATGRASTSSCRAAISYVNDDGVECGTGRLLYVKAQISDDLSDRVVGYSFEDPLFPNYSTANQFLGAEQFKMMVRLGWESTRNGVKSCQ